MVGRLDQTGDLGWEGPMSPHSCWYAPCLEGAAGRRRAAPQHGGRGVEAGGKGLGATGPAGSLGEPIRGIPSLRLWKPWTQTFWATNDFSHETFRRSSTGLLILLGEKSNPLGYKRIWCSLDRDFPIGIMDWDWPPLHFEQSRRCRGGLGSLEVCWNCFSQTI